MRLHEYGLVAQETVLRRCSSPAGAARAPVSQRDVSLRQAVQEHLFNSQLLIAEGMCCCPRAERVGAARNSQACAGEGFIDHEHGRTRPGWLAAAARLFAVAPASTRRELATWLLELLDEPG